MLQSASIDTPVRMVRPLALGFDVVDHWMKSALVSLDPKAEEYDKQLMEIALVCCSSQSAVRFVH